MRAMRVAMTGMVLAGAMVVAAPPANAEERRCTGTIGARTVDNLKVPAGATCRLNGTTVKGSINVNRKARLIAVGVRVVGNVQGENARRIVVRGGSTVGGSIQVVQGRSGLVKRTQVNGGILFDDQNGLVEVLRNRVGADVQLFQNTGGVTVRNNVIDGNLQCKENDPRPRGDNNRVHGSKEDQCRRL